jgi:tetratricopeptide (TPR) repeat protein
MTPDEIYQRAYVAIELGAALKDQQRYEEALAPLTEAARGFAMAAQEGHPNAPGMAVATLIEQGHALMVLGRSREAATTLNNAAYLGEVTGELQHAAFARTQLSMLFLVEKRFDEALREVETALRFFQGNDGMRAAEAGSLAQVGMIHAAAGRFDAAIAAYEQAYAIETELGARARQAHVLGMMGEALDSAGRPEEAAKALRQTLALHEALGSAELAARPRARLEAVLAKLGR